MWYFHQYLVNLHKFWFFHKLHQICYKMVRTEYFLTHYIFLPSFLNIRQNRQKYHLDFHHFGQTWAATSIDPNKAKNRVVWVVNTPKWPAWPIFSETGWYILTGTQKLDFWSIFRKIAIFFWFSGFSFFLKYKKNPKNHQKVGKNWTFCPNNFFSKNPSKYLHFGIFTFPQLPADLEI